MRYSGSGSLIRFRKFRNLEELKKLEELKARTEAAVASVSETLLLNKQLEIKKLEELKKLEQFTYQNEKRKIKRSKLEELKKLKGINIILNDKKIDLNNFLAQLDYHDENEELTLKEARKIQVYIKKLLSDINKIKNIKNIDSQYKEIIKDDDPIKKIKEEINEKLDINNGIINDIRKEQKKINTKISEIINDKNKQHISIKRELHVPSQSPSIILQNIDNINEYYGIDDDIKINLEMNINISTSDNKIQYILKKTQTTMSNRSANGGGYNQNTKQFLKALNKFLAKHKYIVKENKLYKLYTLYDYDNNVVCIIANFDNIYIIQIKEDFFKNNKKILKKYDKDYVKTKLEPLYKSNNLQKLLS